jgi:hypothetical protein
MTPVILPEIPRRQENKAWGTSATMDTCCRIFLGFVTSIVGGGLAAWALVGEWLAHCAYKDNWQAYLEKRSRLAIHVGVVERFICTGALVLAGAKGWPAVAAWLTLKIAARWQKENRDPLKDSDNLWLIGTALSILFAVFGAWIGNKSIFQMPP